MKQVREITQVLHSDRQCQLPEILLEPSMNYELSLFCCIPHCDIIMLSIISPIKTHCMIIEDIIHFDG